MSTVTEIKSYFNLINGQWISSPTGKVLPSINPANKNEVVGYVQDSSVEDLNQAVASAKEAQKQWRRLAGSVRGDYLLKAAAILEGKINEIAETMTKEMGKTFPEAKGETARGVAILRYYAGEGMRSIGDVIPSSDSEALMFTTRVPLGVVGVITPWNFPVAIPIWKVAPALIYGNSVVIKPATETAVTCAKVIECFAEAGIPAGVVNMVTGSGSVIGQGLADHPDINGITFTGSNDVGKRIGQAALARGAKYQLEMGGKNPVIVAADADLDLAVEATISGGLRSTGQKCTATSRVIVHRDVYEPFKEKLVHKVKQISVGDGMLDGIWMGPCANENQQKTVLSYIQKGIEEGAALLTGGKTVEGQGLENGYFVEPTVFENVTSDMTIAREEIFGPVGLVRINAESAGVELQAPFGGMKQSSSHSREQGRAAIEFFTSIKTVFVKS